jgi:predicted permease
VTGLRIAARQLARNPAFSAIVVLTLALGIGASALIYSVIDGVLLKPLPYPRADEIVRVFQVGDGARNRTPPSDPNFADLKEQTHSFAALVQFVSIADSVAGGSEPTRSRIAYVSKGFHDVLGIRPMLGRAFTPEEQQLGGPPAMLISFRYWQRYFGGAADFASHTIRSGDRVFAIVGVMPPSFDYPDGTDLWAPRELIPVNPQRVSHNWQAVGRLAPGTTLAQARADASAVARRLKTQYGDDTWMIDAALVPLRDFEVGNVRPALLVLGASVILLFLVACTNVVNMLLARAVAREQEISVRVALGAGAWRLGRQFLTETIVLCGAGGALGVAIAWCGIELLTTLHGGTLPRADAIGIDWVAVAVAAALSLGAAATLSLLLARHATRRSSRLEVNTRGTAGPRRSWLREGLVSAQAGMAVVLLVGAVLLGRSFMRLMDVDPGFRTDDLLLMNLALPRPPEGADTAPLARFHEELMERVRALPRVTAVGGAVFAPLARRPTSSGVFLELRRPDEVQTMDDFNRLWKDPARTGMAEFRVASEGYFDALGIPLLRGRLFEHADGPGAEHVAVVSRSLAEQKWPGEDPLGRLIQFGNMDGDLTPFRIVGVVGDVREFGVDADARPTFYGYYRQRTVSLGWSWWVAIRARNADGLVPAAREIVRGMNDQLVPEFATGAQLFSASVAPRRFNLVMLGVFGAAALLLALAGIYGAIAFNVAQRTREIGVRVALGAQTQSVVAMVLRRSFAWVGTGVAAGLLVALGASRALGSLLYGISAHDPVAYAAAAGALLIAAIGAAWLPALRAARVDPVVALRSE